MKHVFVNVLGMMIFSLILPCFAEEIFFDLSDHFNARILATDADRTSGRGFEGKKNGKCLNPPLAENRYITTQDVTSPSANMGFKTGPIESNNTLLLKHGESAEIILHGNPKLTLFGLLYFERNFRGGKGFITVKYTDGTSQKIPWNECSASGHGSCSYSRNLISKIGEFEYVDTTYPGAQGYFPLYNQLFPGINPNKPIRSIVLDMKTFTKAPKDAEWAIFGITGNGVLTAKTNRSIVNANRRHYLAAVSPRKNSPAVDTFETADKWRLQKAPGKRIYLSSTHEKPLFHDRVTRIEINAESLTPLVMVPKQKMRLPEKFNAMSFYVYTDGYVYRGFPNALSLVVTLTGENGKKKYLNSTLNYSGWSDVLYNFSAKERAELGKNVYIESLKFSGYNKGETRILYLADLAFYENKKSLTFKKQPKRNIQLLPGADPGVNTGNGYLPFPTRETTILPFNFTKNFKNAQSLNKNGAVFIYNGKDCKITYTYIPATGRLDDLTCEIIYPDGFKRKFIPAKNGGFKFTKEKRNADSAKLLALRKVKNQIVAEWEYRIGKEIVKGCFRFRIVQKSLLIDTLCPGGAVTQVEFGKSIGIPEARLVQIPFYNYSSYTKFRPCVAAAGTMEHPLFYAGHVDWYLSNGSEPYSHNSTLNDEIISNGGVRYIAKNDGRRNHCAERLFLNVSPDFEEVLPQVANPKSPWHEYTYNHLYYTWSPPPVNSTVRKFAKVLRGGIKKIVFRLHHDENLTTHTKFLPSRGGDQLIYRFVEELQTKRGIRLGPYVDYTDIYPANPAFNVDDVSIGMGGQYEKCWPGAYTRKPVRIAEEAGSQLKALKDKFKFKMVYGDVQTAIAPWGLVDYDSRVPGAGTFSQAFYSYGQSFLDMKKNVDGPFYSEGMFHSFYAGLTDGDYGQDRGYRTAIKPWLVNYNLRALHDIGACQGMGMLYQFMAGCGYDFNKNREIASDTIDRHVAATLIFGHSPIDPIGSSIGTAVWRMGFMAMPIISEHAKSSVDSIRYADETGKWFSSSHSALKGIYEQSKVSVKYKNGVTITVNGSKDPSLLVTEVDGQKLLLPRNGYAAWNKDKTIFVYSGNNEHGSRYDYTETPDHIYIDGRGSAVFQRLAAADGPAVLHRISANEYEFIPFLDEFSKDYKTSFHKEPMSAGFRMKVKSVQALKWDRTPLNKKVSVEYAEGYAWIKPVPGAYSYLVKGTLDRNFKAAKSYGKEVFAGETFTYTGKDHKSRFISVPVNARPGYFLAFGSHLAVLKEPFFLSVKTGNGKSCLNIQCNGKYYLGGKPRLFVGNQKIEFRFDKNNQYSYIIKNTLPPGGKKVLNGKFQCGKYEREFKLVLQNEIRPRNYVVLTDKNLVFSATPRESTGVMASSSGEVALLNAIHGSKDDTVNFAASGAGMMTSTSLECGKILKAGIGLQVPYKNCSGGFVSQTSGTFTIPAISIPRLKFSCGKRDVAGNNGDGMQFVVTLTEKDTGKKHVLFDKIVDACVWADADIDLAPWKGKTVSLRFVCDSRLNCSCDYGALSYPVVTDVRKDYVFTVKLELGKVNALQIVKREFPSIGLKWGGKGVKQTKDGFMIDGSGYRPARVVWPVDPGKTYRLSGKFKASVPAAKKSNYLFVGLSCSDKSGKYIHPAMVNAVKGTETKLKKAAKKGATQLEIEEDSNWIVANGKVVFNVKEDFSDLPNNEFVSIKSMKNKTITLAVPLKKDYLAGTPIREHRSSDSYMYCFQIWPLPADKWTEFHQIISGELLSGIAKDKFWPGTRNVHAVLLTDQPNVLFKDLKLEEME